MFDDLLKQPLNLSDVVIHMRIIQADLFPSQPWLHHLRCTLCERPGGSRVGSAWRSFVCLRRLVPHQSEVMLGMLIVVLRFHRVSGRGRGTREHHVALVVPFGVSQAIANVSFPTPLP